MSEVWVYHERQESALCGQHCLNNLLQYSCFTVADLSDIALQMDASERQLNHDASYVSGNVDESGNFSVQVLRTALQRSYGLDLVSWSSEEGRGAVTDPTTENAFIVNADQHWFAIRKINGHWWDLNSTLDKPVYISNFYLSALLSQYRAEGCTVFLVAGALSSSASKPDPASYSTLSQCYTEDELLPPAQRKPVSAVSSTLSSTPAFSGTGRKLGSATSSAIDLTVEEEGDEDLKRALEMSMQEQYYKPIEKTDKEKMREQRLKMLQK